MGGLGWAIDAERGKDNGDFDYDSVTSDISCSSCSSNGDDGDDGDDDDNDDEYDNDDDCNNNERVVRNVGIEPPEARTTTTTPLLRRVNSHMEPPASLTRTLHDTNTNNNKSTLRRIHSHSHSNGNSSPTTLKAMGLKKRISKEELKKLYTDRDNTSRELMELKEEVITLKYQLLVRSKELKDIRIERGDYIRKLESLEETNDNLVLELSSMRMSSSTSHDCGRGRGSKQRDSRTTTSSHKQRDSRTSKKSNSSFSRKNSKSTSTKQRDISDKSITIMDPSFDSPIIDYEYGDTAEDMNNNNNNNNSNSYNNRHNSLDNSKTSMGSSRSRQSRRNSTIRRSSICLKKPIDDEEEDDDNQDQDYNGIATKTTKLGRINSSSSSSRDINYTKKKTKKKTKDVSRRASSYSNSMNNNNNNNSTSSINEEESEGRHNNNLLKHDEPLKSKRSPPKQNGSNRVSRRSSML